MKFLEQLKKELESNYPWGDYTSWTNRHFQKISDDILEATGILISHMTLKRMYGKIKTKEDYAPNASSLDAICQFLGHKGWDEYMKTHSSKNTVSAQISKESKNYSETKEDNEPKPTSKPNKANLFLVAGTLGAISILTIVYYVIYNKPIKDNSPKISIDSFSYTLTTDHAPTTAIINYESTPAIETLDSLYFNSGYRQKKEKSWKLLANKNSFDVYYPYSGIYKTIFKYKAHTIQSSNIVVPSANWEYSVNLDKRNLLTLIENDYELYNGFKVSQEKSDELKSSFHEFNVRKYGPLGIKLKNAQLSMTFKGRDDIDEASECKYMRVFLMTTNSSLKYYLADNSCAVSNFIQYQGKTIDLNTEQKQAFLFDMYQENEINFEVIKDSILSIKNGKKSFELSLPNTKWLDEELYGINIITYKAVDIDSFKVTDNTNDSSIIIGQ